MSVVIRYLVRREDAMPLKNVISYAAEQSGRSPHEIARMMTWFLEGIVNEVSMGRVVRIPGFGMFAPLTYRVPKPLMSNGDVRVRPYFSAANGFRLQIMSSVVPDFGRNARFQRARSRGQLGSTRAESRTSVTMAEIRRHIDKQIAS